MKPSAVPKRPACADEAKQGRHMQLSDGRLVFCCWGAAESSQMRRKILNWSNGCFRHSGVWRAVCKSGCSRPTAVSGSSSLMRNSNFNRVGVKFVCQAANMFISAVRLDMWTEVSKGTDLPFKVSSWVCQLCMAHFAPFIFFMIS